MVLGLLDPLGYVNSLASASSWGSVNYLSPYGSVDLWVWLGSISSVNSFSSVSS